MHAVKARSGTIIGMAPVGNRNGIWNTSPKILCYRFEHHSMQYLGPMNVTESLVTNSQSKRIRSLSLDRDELRRLLDILQERSFAAGDIEVSRYQQGALTPEQHEANKTIIKEEGFRLFVTISGRDGAKLFGNIETVFSSPNFPEDVVSVFFDSSIPLRARNFTPRNKCILNLDFSRPSVFNFTLMPTHETPNVSNIAVEGSDATWVHGLFHEVDKFFSEHSSSARFLHRHGIYDVLVMMAGFPVAFWLCYRLSPLVSKLFTSPFLSAAIYVYLFFLSLWGFRVLFHYARWIWPLLEFRGPRNKALKHKILWSTLAGGLLVAVVYDLLKAAFISG